MNETEIIKDKIQEILRMQKVSKYDLALDIGISHATLYNFLSGIDISQKCLNKLAHFVRTYVTPEQKIEAYKLDAIEYEAKIKKLKAENDRLKARKDKYYQQTLDDEIQINELLHTLQEIKTIAEYIMTSDTEKWTLDEPFKQIEKILELTKAEEEE